MERAFFHTSEGVWIAIDDPSPEILASYPAGTQEIPLPPGPDHQWTGDAWVHIPPGPPPVPQVVSRFQARAALHVAGLLPQAEAAISQADALTQMAWADAVSFQRTSPTIAAMAATLGLTEAQVDDLFRAAMGVKA